MFQDIDFQKQTQLELPNAHAQLEKLLTERTAELTEANTRLKQEIAEHQQTRVDLKTVESELQQAKEQLRALLDAVPGFVSWISSEGRYLGVNQNLANSFNLSPDAFVGKELGFLQTSPEFVQFMEQFIASSIPTNCQVIDVKVNSSTRSYLVAAQKYDQSASAVSVGIDITEGKCAEEQLRQSQEQLHMAFDAAQMGYWDCDMRTGTSTWSNNFKRLFGIDLDNNEASYPAFLEYVHPEDRDRIHQVSLHCLETKQVGDTEFRIIYPDGNIRWIQSKFKFFYDEIGKPLRKIGIDLDITKRKQAEAEIQESLREKEILLQEIHHRVKNNLQVISSLLDLQSQRLTDQTTLKMFQESQNRIKLMALVHETLYRSKDFAKINFADYVKNLTDFLFSAYKTESNNITLELEIDQVFINLDQAIPCAFIISELVSNSLKYAFAPQQKGTIKITIKTRPNQWLELVIADNGVGLPVDCNLNNISSLGLKLVQVLTEQLEGTLELDHRNGTHFTISLPAE